MSSSLGMFCPKLSCMCNVKQSAVDVSKEVMTTHRDICRRHHVGTFNGLALVECQHPLQLLFACAAAYVLTGPLTMVYQPCLRLTCVSAAVEVITSVPVIRQRAGRLCSLVCNRIWRRLTAGSQGAINAYA